MSEPKKQALNQYVLTFKCPDKLGVVAKFSTLMHNKGAFITEVSHFSDSKTQMFFSRTEFDDRSATTSFESLEKELNQLADDMNMEFTLRLANYRPKVLLAVSKYDHCLNVLLTKWRSGALKIDIVGIVSNHDDCRGKAEFYNLPYHHLPITKETKPQQEAEILALIEKTGADLLVLARYMQILSDNMCDKLEGRAINIHHSFLPSFKGAKPYHQAHERGVKVIGATAHYVTADLDEGPIIVQEVKPIDHRMSAEQMVHVGHDIEATALAQAVKLHCEERIVLNGHRTIIL